MQQLLSLIKCPVTRSILKLTAFTTSIKHHGKSKAKMVKDGILYSLDGHWFYPVINGIPRLTIEAFEDYERFFKKNLKDYEVKKTFLLKNYGTLIKSVRSKNKKTKESFTMEWSNFDYQKDKTWDADPNQMLDRFLEETGETRNSIDNKLILDAGCGNGLLDTLIAGCGATVVAMDLSLSIERAFQNNEHPSAFFIQGDVRFPPF